MTNHSKNKKSLNASDMINELIQAVNIMGPILGQYKETFNERKTMKPEVGEFYRTYDGSVVHVIPIEEEEESQLSGLAALFGGKMKTLSGSDADDNDAAIKKSARGEVEQKEPEKYAVVVVRGGHGIDNFRGDKPGSEYNVGPDGLTMFGDARLIDEAGKPKYDGSVSFAFMPLVAMSLKSKIKATFED